MPDKSVQKKLCANTALKVMNDLIQHKSHVRVHSAGKLSMKMLLEAEVNSEQSTIVSKLKTSFCLLQALYL